MLATKGNREVKIDANQQGAFEKEGYLVYDSVTLELKTVKPADVSVENETLKLEIGTLKAEIETLKGVKGLEFTNDNIKEILKGLNVEFKEKDNKATLEGLLINKLNPIGEK